MDAEKIVEPGRLAVVYMKTKASGITFHMPVAHVFDTSKGFAIVEADYFETNYTGRDCLHYIDAKPGADGSFETESYIGRLEVYLSTEQQYRDANDAFKYLKAAMAAKGITMESERAELARIVGKNDPG